MFTWAGLSLTEAIMANTSDHKMSSKTGRHRGKMITHMTLLVKLNGNDSSEYMDVIFFEQEQE